MPDDTGFLRIPDRYTNGGRETCDLMRDYSHEVGEAKGIDGDALFAFACFSHYLKYKSRVKDPHTDPEKAEWWLSMYEHVSSPDAFPDPRHKRTGFVPYSYVPTKK
jgi:hypothetical protein